MLTDSYCQLKTELYSIADDAIIVSSNPTGMPFRLIIWGEAITNEEARTRTECYGRPDRKYLILNNPTTSDAATVSVIETNDPDAAATVGRGLLVRCCRVLTPAAAQREVDRWRSTYAYRLVRRSRVPKEQEFAHLLEGGELVVRNVGYEPDLPRWPLSAHTEGTVHAICLNDRELATMLAIAIGGMELQGPGAA